MHTDEVRSGPLSPSLQSAERGSMKLRTLAEAPGFSLKGISEILQYSGRRVHLYWFGGGLIMLSGTCTVYMMSSGHFFICCVCAAYKSRMCIYTQTVVYGIVR